jgi:hypothetical protein
MCIEDKRLHEKEGLRELNTGHRQNKKYALINWLCNKRTFSFQPSADFCRDKPGNIKGNNKYTQTRWWNIFKITVEHPRNNDVAGADAIVTQTVKLEL